MNRYWIIGWQEMFNILLDTWCNIPSGRRWKDRWLRHLPITLVRCVYGRSRLVRVVQTMSNDSY